MKYFIILLATIFASINADAQSIQPGFPTGNGGSGGGSNINIGTTTGTAADGGVVTGLSNTVTSLSNTVTGISSNVNKLNNVSVYNRAPAQSDDWYSGYATTGDLSWVKVTTAGSYGSVPTVSFTGGGCTTEPTATAMMNTAGTGVAQVVPTSPGVGCTSAPTVAFSPTGAAATAYLQASPMEWRDQNGRVWQIIQSTQGKALWQEVRVPSVYPADAVPYVISAVTSTGGTGYAVNDTVTLPDGTIAKVTAQTGGAPTAYSLNVAANTQCRPASVSGLTQTATSGSGVGAVLAETYTGHVELYGMRQMTACYTGNLMDVIRADNGQTLTVGSVAGGALDIGAITSFCKGSTCQVGKIYEQSGAGSAFDIPAVATAANRTVIIPGLLVGNVPGVTSAQVPSYYNTNAVGQSPSGGIAVPNPPSSAATQNYSVLLVGRTFGGLAGNYLWQASNAVLSMASNDGNMYHCGGGNGNVTAELSLLNPAVYTLSLGTGSSGSVVTCNESSTATAGYGSNVAVTGQVIANSASNGSMVAGVDVVNRALSVQDMAVARAALYGAFGIQPQARDIQICEGDSMTAGTNALAGQTYCVKTIAKLGLPARAYGNGVSGAKTTDRLTAFDANIRPLYRGNVPRVTLMVEMGYNDTITNSLPASGAETALNTYVGLAKGLGSNARIVLGTVPESVAASPTAAQIQANLLSAWIVANSAGADGIADIAGDPIMGSASSTNGTYYAGGIHPSDIGYDNFAQIMAGAINQVALH